MKFYFVLGLLIVGTIISKYYQFRSLKHLKNEYKQLKTSIFFPYRFYPDKYYEDEEGIRYRKISVAIFIVCNIIMIYLIILIITNRSMN